MKTSIVVGDLQSHRVSALLGTTAEALVFEAFGPRGLVRLTCDRVTGARIEATTEEIVAPGPSTAVETDGVRLAIRRSSGRRELCRFHAHGWIEPAFELAPTARLVATDTHLLAIDIIQGRPFVWALGASGPVVTFALPAWMVTDAATVPSVTIWSVIAASPGRALVFVSQDRVSWLAFEQIAALHERIPQLLPHGKLEFCAAPGVMCDGKVFPSMETRPNAWPTPGSKARELVTPQVRARVMRLAQLGLAETLDEAAVDDAITSAFGRAQTVPPHGAVSAAMILRAHWLAHPPAEDRARLDKDAIAFAARANAAASGTRRWSLVITHNSEPLVVALDAAQRDAIEREGLLLFEPLPSYAPLPEDLASAVAELATLIGAGPDDVVLTDDGRILLSLLAASTLECHLGAPAR